MAGKLDNVPQPVREAIATALMVASVTATAAVLLQQPLFIPGGFILFLLFYILRINPKIKEYYQTQEQQSMAQYADDDTYQPLLDRFMQDQNDDALIEQYQIWKQGPHENDVRMRFLQSAILALIDAKKIYRVEDLMNDFQKLAEAEGLSERFEAFRSNCDMRIAEIAQARL